ncbi:MAG: hypothetical protein ACK52X_02815 [bacterium]
MRQRRTGPTTARKIVHGCWSGDQQRQAQVPPEAHRSNNGIDYLARKIILSCWSGEKKGREIKQKKPQSHPPLAERHLRKQVIRIGFDPMTFRLRRDALSS